MLDIVIVRMICNFNKTFAIVQDNRSVMVWNTLRNLSTWTSVDSNSFLICYCSFHIWTSDAEPHNSEIAHTYQFEFYVRSLWELFSTLSNFCPKLLSKPYQRSWIFRALPCKFLHHFVVHAPKLLQNGNILNEDKTGREGSLESPLTTFRLS